MIYALLIGGFGINSSLAIRPITVQLRLVPGLAHMQVDSLAERQSCVFQIKTQGFVRMCQEERDPLGDIVL